MCEGCVFLDSRDEYLKKHPGCNGAVKQPFMTMDDLKNNLFHKWMMTGKKHFNIAKDAIIDCPQDYAWMAKHYESGKKEKISVDFL